MYCTRLDDKLSSWVRHVYALKSNKKKVCKTLAHNTKTSFIFKTMYPEKAQLIGKIFAFSCIISINCTKWCASEYKIKKVFKKRNDDGAEIHKKNMNLTAGRRHTVPRIGDILKSLLQPFVAAAQVVIYGNFKYYTALHDRKFFRQTFFLFVFMATGKLNRGLELNCPKPSIKLHLSNCF